jgi:hypothetical protein
MDLIRSVPAEIFEEILFYIPASVIHNECSINNYVNQYCNNEHFWERYVKNKYNIEDLVKWENRSIDKWEYLKNRAGNTFDIKPSWSALSVWLEESKPIRINDRQGIKYIPISGYEKLHNYSEINAPPFIIENFNKKYYISVYGNVSFNLDKIPKVKGNTRIRDILIEGQGILYKIKTATEYFSK